MGFRTIASFFLRRETAGRPPLADGKCPSSRKEEGIFFSLHFAVTVLVAAALFPAAS